MEFPTQAEHAIEEWKELSVTMPFKRIALRYGAFRDDDRTTFPPTIEWIFPDESVARVTGRGFNHCITAELP